MVSSNRVVTLVQHLPQAPNLTPTPPISSDHASRHCLPPLNLMVAYIVRLPLHAARALPFSQPQSELRLRGGVGRLAVNVPQWQPSLEEWHRALQTLPLDEHERITR